MLQALVFRHVMSHFRDALRPDAHFLQVHRDAHALKEGVGFFDGLFRNFLRRKMGVDAEDVDAVLDKARERPGAQDVLHPAGRDNGQAHAVGDVIVAAEGVLDAVHRPTGFTVSQAHDVVARQGAHEHHFCARPVVLGVFQAGFSVHHQALEAGLAEAVVHEGGVFAEVLLQDVVHGVRHACRRLVFGDAEGVTRVQERYFGKHERREVAQLVIGFRAGDDAAAIIFAAGSRQGENVHDGKGFHGRGFAGDEIPGIPVKAGAARNGLGAVQHGAAAHGKDYLNLVLLAQFNTFQHRRIILGIGPSPFGTGLCAGCFRPRR